MLKKFFSKNGRYYWFTSPWVIATILTVIFIFVYPEFFCRYKVDYRVILSTDTDLKTYADMNGDGKDDKLKISKEKFKAWYTISALKKKVKLEKTPIFSKHPVAEDYNGDGFKELYLLSKSQDSIFLTIWDYRKNNLRNVFLETVQHRFKFDKLGFVDCNNDGSKECYFWFSSAREVNKRFVCRYDIKNNIVKKTKGIDVRFRGGYIENIYGEPRIVLTSSSYSTIHSPKPKYSEKNAWVLVLDKDLNFAIDPIRYEKSNSCLVCMNVKVNGENNICVVGDCNNRTKLEKDNSFISVFDYSGNKLNEVIVYHDLYINKGGYFKIDGGNNSKIFITSRSGGILKYDGNLHYEGTFYPGGLSKPIAGLMADLDNDGENEIMFRDISQKKIVFTKADLSHPVLFNKPEPYTLFLGCSNLNNIYENIYNTGVAHMFKKHTVKKENVILNYKGLTYFLNYAKDKYFWIKYIYALTVFIVSFFIVWWIRYFVTKSVEEKYVIDNTIAQLKFQNVRNQMSPHFTLNAMNSIASLIYKEEREAAYDYLCKLAKLVRNSLIDANRLERSLKEELDFVSSYLDLQKFRFRNRFDYIISVDKPTAYYFKVMPFLVQTFVENSMKHGLKDVGSGGKIIVDVTSLFNGIKIVIEDNGQGRKAAAKNKTQSTGKGIKLVNEYINIINKKDNRNMSVTVIDLEENKKPRGTRVEIFIDNV